MDLSELNDEQLQAALREAVQKYIFLTLHSDPEELPDDKVFRSSLMGDILKEVGKRKIKQ